MCYCHHPHFSDEKTKSQGCGTICPSSYVCLRSAEPCLPWRGISRTPKYLAVQTSQTQEAALSQVHSLHKTTGECHLQPKVRADPEANQYFHLNCDLRGSYKPGLHEARKVELTESGRFPWRLDCAKQHLASPGGAGTTGWGRSPQPPRRHLGEHI